MCSAAETIFRSSGVQWRLLLSPAANTCHPHPIEERNLETKTFSIRMSNLIRICLNRLLYISIKNIQLDCFWVLCNEENLFCMCIDLKYMPTSHLNICKKNWMQKCYIIQMFYFIHLCYRMSRYLLQIMEQDRINIKTSFTLHRHIYYSGGPCWSVNSKHELCRDH